MSCFYNTILYFGFLQTCIVLGAWYLAKMRLFALAIVSAKMISKSSLQHAIDSPAYFRDVRSGSVRTQRVQTQGGKHNWVKLSISRRSSVNLPSGNAKYDERLIAVELSQLDRPECYRLLQNWLLASMTILATWKVFAADRK